MGCSSTGRAPDCYSGGWWFDSTRPSHWEHHEQRRVLARYHVDSFGRMDSSNSRAVTDLLLIGENNAKCITELKSKLEIMEGSTTSQLCYGEASMWSESESTPIRLTLCTVGPTQMGRGHTVCTQRWMLCDFTGLEIHSRSCDFYPAEVSVWLGHVTSV